MIGKRYMDGQWCFRNCSKKPKAKTKVFEPSKFMGNKRTVTSTRRAAKLVKSCY